MKYKNSNSAILFLLYAVVLLSSYLLAQAADRIEIHSHPVFGLGNHAILVVRDVDSTNSFYANHGISLQEDSNGNDYFTLSATDVNDKVFSSYNRTPDSLDDSDVEYQNEVTIPSGYSSVEAFVEDIVMREEAYQDDVDYNFLSAGDDHNSNGYISGILNGIGGAIGALVGWFPGANDPIDNSKFD